MEALLHLGPFLHPLTSPPPYIATFTISSRTPGTHFAPPLCHSHHASPPPTIQVLPPPPAYDFRAEIRQETLDVVQNSYPQLMDLVQDGTLVVVRRPDNYVERRSDGYEEPKLVFVVGTAHMSRVSAAQVERVVKTVRPENVVVELCRSRAGIMYQTSVVQSQEVVPVPLRGHNLMSMTGESFTAAMGRSLKLGGRSALALRLLLAGVSQRLSSAAGVPTGEEFRAARRASEEVGAQLVLGDRPIEITLQRAWGALQWTEKLKLASTLLRGIGSINLDASEEALEALKRDDVLSALFSELSLQFPSLMQPLIHERDRYLAWSLKRSKAVNGCSRVVGVLGQGHMRGVVFALKHDQEHLRFRDLVGGKSYMSVRKENQVTQFFRNLVIESAVGVILWLAYDNLSHTYFHW